MMLGAIEWISVIAAGGGLAGLAAGLSRRPFDIAKGLTDLAVGGLCLLLSLPVLAVCAVIIKLSSPGPVLLAQWRMGRGGKVFRMLKLRTMIVDAEPDGRPVWAADNDPRVVPACRWMRTSHIDELPQLLNVLRGEMSLVGPRPERPEILEDLAGRYPHVYRRLDVLPGITGLAQVRWSYDTTPERFRHKLASDLEYIDTCNWFLDAAILLATFPKFIDRQAR